MAINNDRYGAIDNIARGLANEALKKIKNAKKYHAGEGLNESTAGNDTTFSVDKQYLNDAIDAEVDAIGVGGSTLTITFGALLAGAEFTVSGSGETRTGVVPEGLVVVLTGIMGTETEYTISAIVEGVTFSTAVTTPQYYGNVSATLVGFGVFGVMWDPANTSTELTRLTKATDPNHYVTVDISAEPSPATGTGNGSSPFDVYAPWKGMDEYNIISGAVSYKRGDEGFSRTSYDTVVFIPEFYFKTVYDSENNKCYFYIAGGALTGFEKHPGSGNYVGKYNTISGHYSKSGNVPLTNLDRPTFRSGATSKGEKWCLYDVASWMAIQYLYLIEFADWNSQAKIGTGIVSTGSKSNTGLTDTMVYHTGQISSGSAVMYRWIENPWGNVWDHCDGFNANNRAVYICTDPSKYADTITSDYVSAGVTLPSSNGYIKSLGFSSAFPWAFLPDTIGGSETSYIPDYVSGNSGLLVLYAGGSYYNDLRAGLFGLNAYDAASYAYGHVGARLRFIP